MQDDCLHREFDGALEDRRGHSAGIGRGRVDGEATESIAAAAHPLILVGLVLAVLAAPVLLMVLVMVAGRDRLLCSRQIKPRVRAPDKREREQHDETPDEDRAHVAAHDLRLRGPLLVAQGSGKGKAGQAAARSGVGPAPLREPLLRRGGRSAQALAHVGAERATRSSRLSRRTTRETRGQPRWISSMR